ncbi:CHAT domain-containing protein [Roridomyces roridus]|uniref:CHAT domain-containing protein n=1 Tax=Roridomyces roridus TaxID=1738132 RepID=A0AAD7B3N5_9AGAR|nr:CHAT domain-containing protein [Roridomyces roridus]
MHSIRVTAPAPPGMHPDLPANMQMFAQLLVNGNIIQQTGAVDTEEQSLEAVTWKMKFDCDLPVNIPNFQIAIIRKLGSVRILGSVSLTWDEAFSFGQVHKPYKMALTKVNNDGPSLNMTVAFSVVPVPQNDYSDIPADPSNGIHVFSMIKQMLQETQQGKPLDLHQLCALHTNVLLLTQNSRVRGKLANFLGDICFKQWEMAREAATLDQAVQAYGDAIRDGLTDAGSLQDLSVALFQRIEKCGDTGDIDRCIAVMEESVQLTSDGDSLKSARLSNLANCLLRRYQNYGALEDLDRCITLGRHAIKCSVDGDLDQAANLNNLGTALDVRYDKLGDLADLNDSISMRMETIQLTPDGHPDRPTRLANLAASLLSRADHLNDLEDLNQAVVLGEQAVNLTPENRPTRAFLLSNLGSSLMSRFDQLGNVDDLSRAVVARREAVRVTPAGNPSRPTRLSSLATSLMEQFAQCAQVDDLNESVALRTEVVFLTPDGHPDKAGWLANLGDSLEKRFEFFGDLDDLHKSLALIEDAVNLTPDGHPSKAERLSNLGSSLLIWYEKLGDLEDLNRSITVHTAAVGLTPDTHVAKPFHMNNLGASLTRRYENTKNIEDLTQSVMLKQKLLELIPESHLKRGLMLSNLGGSLLELFKDTGDSDHLSQAVTVNMKALQLISDGHSEKPAILINLGNCLFEKFEKLQDEQAGHEAISMWSQAACSETGSIHVRFHAASIWAQYARKTQDPSFMKAYEVAIGMLPELAWIGLSIRDRHLHIMQASELVRNGARAAIVSGNPELAVEWLEQGRSVIWSQLLNLRTPVDDLKEKHPQLASKFLDLSVQLEKSGGRKMDLSETDIRLQSDADLAHRNAHERRKLLDEIRTLKGFENFLMPKKFHQLLAAAQGGPVVLLNSAEESCDALILLSGINEVIHVPLNFQPINMGDITADMGSSNARLNGIREGEKSREDRLLAVLSDIWKGIVQPVFQALAITKPTKSDLARLWWYPTGSLAFLPIHAAGLYGAEETFGSKVSDYVISSYTPSLSALIIGFEHASKPRRSTQLLAVSQPIATGQVYIPGTRTELKYIQQAAHGKIRVVSLDETTATPDRVMAEMRNCSWAHFACHGVQDAGSPIESALLLANDSRLTLAQIFQLSLQNADLAFLSACQTATGSKYLPEESVHLAAGLLFAGYRGVIATMWTIMDNDAPQVAKDVYDNLLGTSPPDSTRAAEALHFAVQRMREGPGGKSLLEWVPYIHVGV